MVPRHPGDGALTASERLLWRVARGRSIPPSTLREATGARREAIQNIRTGGCVETVWHPEPV